MLSCYAAVLIALVVGLGGGVALGLRSGALEVEERFASGEWMRRVDIGAGRSLS